MSENLTYRQIFLDGRALPEVVTPSFMGYSVGHWEGDSLVVDAQGRVTHFVGVFVEGNLIVKRIPDQK